MPLDLSTVRPSAIGRELGDSIRISLALDEADDDDWGDVPAMPAMPPPPAMPDALPPMPPPLAMPPPPPAPPAAPYAPTMAKADSVWAGAALLPPGWQSHSSEEGEYYHNALTGETSWERPTSQRLSGVI